MTSKPAKLPKFMIVAYASSAPKCIICMGDYEPHKFEEEGSTATKCTKFIPDRTVKPFCYKPPEGRDELVDRHNPVNPKDKDSKTDGCKDPTLPYEYSAYSQNFTSMVTQVESMWGGQLCSTTTMQHRIELKNTDNRPIFSAPYRAGPKSREFEKQEMNGMRAMNIIEPAQTELVLPILFVPKKEGNLRIWLHYHNLNAETIQDSYPISSMDEWIYSLCNTMTSLTFDTNSGHCQVEIAKEDRDQTTFTSHHSLFQLRAVPFGLKNMPEMFQRTIDVILKKVKG